jgi:hypothetical protein
MKKFITFMIGLAFIMALYGLFAEPTCERLGGQTNAHRECIFPPRIGG